MLATLQSAFLTSSSIWINAILFLIIISTCYFGDKLLAIQNRHHRAACDNATHALIGGLCWAVVENDRLLNTWRSWMRCFICIFLAMSVDFDHFIAAGTLNIERASHLSTRPFLHNTSLILVIVLLCWFFRHKMDVITIIALMILSSCLSHHLRDANRRGLWLFPFGSTPPLSFSVYVFSIICLSLFVRFVKYNYISSDSSDTNIGTFIA